ncbi:MAG: LruC domain-containing protein [Bacteroidota bacterium]
MRHTITSVAIMLCCFLSIFITSCVKEIDDFQEPAAEAQSPITNMDQMVVPDNFHYESDKKVNLNIRILDGNDSPLPGVRINIMDKSPDDGGIIYYTGGTDNNGYLTGEARLPGKLDQVIIHTGYLGVMNDAVINVSGSMLNCVVGGSNPQAVAVDNQRMMNSTIKEYGNALGKLTAVPTMKTFGTWNSNGVPNYLFTPNDVVTTALTTRINATLPDKKVPNQNPGFLTAASYPNIVLTQRADVYVTFFHEGSTAKNSLAFYAYNKNTPPANVAAIPSIKAVFPNMSYSGSGGGMITGQRVKIGNFGADTVIAFVLMTASFNTPNITNGTNQFYTNENLNPEGSTTLRRHNVCLWDDADKRMIIGFEETLRSAAKCDQDFNDAIVLVTTSPAMSVNTSNYAKITNTTDSDGDGVIDALDEFPTNAAMAYSSSYPSAIPSVYGHLAFEDLWPARGDYDLNDLIVGYRFQEFKNAANKIVKIDGKFFVNAAGGSYKHGFGFQLPVSPSVITSVTGSVIKENYISLSAKGLENKQNKSVIIVFDNSHKTIVQPVGYFINTQSGAPFISGDSVSISVTFSVPQTSAAIGLPPYNPFIISNMRRGYEIHLADMAPTDLADPALFNTLQDSTNIATGRYYKSANNIPWAVNIPGSYGIVLEKTNIIDAYLKFTTWAQSGGTTYSDWYSNAPGYRDTDKIFGSGK